MLTALNYTEHTAHPLPSHADKYPKLSHILSAVSLATGASVLDIRSARRTKDIIVPRQMYVYLARKLTLASYPQIAMTINRDHTTAVHAYFRIQEKIDGGDFGLFAKITETKALVDQLTRQSGGEGNE